MLEFFFPELALFDSVVKRVAHELRGGDTPELAEAYSNASQAIQGNPFDGEAYFTRGLANRGQGRDAEALADFCKVLRIDPRHAKAWLMVSEVLIGLGEYDLARTARINALELDPSLA